MILAYCILGIGVVLNVLANVLAKIGVTRFLNETATGPTPIIQLITKIITNSYFIASIVIFGLAFMAYTFSLTKIKLSITYPIYVSATMILIVLSSQLFLSESITLPQIVGTLVIIGGIVILMTS